MVLRNAVAAVAALATILMAYRIAVNEGVIKSIENSKILDPSTMLHLDSSAFPTINSDPHHSKDEGLPPQRSLIKEDDHANYTSTTIDVLVFNRVPRSGSQTMMEILRLLSTRNRFYYQMAQTYENEVIDLTYNEQIWLSNFIQFIPAPSVYIRHLKFLDFKRLNVSRSSYFSIVRDPVERIISWFYYIRAPWYFPERKRSFSNISKPSRSWILHEFEACVISGDKECTFDKEQIRNDFSQLTEYFCGQDDDCRNFNDAAVLSKAMANIEQHYTVVGVLEDLNKTMEVLENYIPYYFRGSQKLYMDHHEHFLSMSRNIYKPEVDEKVKNMVSQTLTIEIALFQFCRQRLHKQFHEIQ